MNFDSLLSAPWQVQIHAIAAMIALALGVVQFAAPKGTLPHKTIGALWIMLMSTITLSAAFIVHPRAAGESFFTHFTFIHYIFIPLTAYGLIGGIRFLRAGGKDLKKHSGPFRGIFIGGLIIAGGFTFMPGRIMHDVVFNKEMSPNPCLYPTAYLYFLPGAKTPERKLNPYCTALLEKKRNQ